MLAKIKYYYLLFLGKDFNNSVTQNHYTCCQVLSCDYSWRQNRLTIESNFGIVDKVINFFLPANV